MTAIPARLRSEAPTSRPVRQAAALWLIPVVAVIVLTALLPLAGVFDASLHTRSPTGSLSFVGTRWFEQMFVDPEVRDVLLRQLAFSATVLAVEVPLGVALALALPRDGWRAALAIVIVALPLFMPWAAVSGVWRIAGHPEFGVLGATLTSLGVGWNPAGRETDAWLLRVVMDVWHWTPMVALLCHAVLRTIPATHEHAALLDGLSRSGRFRYLAWPRLRVALVAAALLRVLDSLMFPAAPLLSFHLAGVDAGGADAGPAAALSLLVYLAVAVLGVVLYLQVRRLAVAGALMTAGEDLNHDRDGGDVSGGREADRQAWRRLPRPLWGGGTLLVLLWLAFALLPIVGLVAIALTPAGVTLSASLPAPAWPTAPTGDHFRALFADMGIGGVANPSRWTDWFRSLLFSLGYATLSTLVSLLIALPAAYALSRHAFVGDRTVMAWLLVNRVTPPALLLAPALQGIALVGLGETAVGVAMLHLLFTLPLAVWILEGTMSRVPRALDEAALVDGHTFGHFAIRILLPLIRPGLAVAAAFCFVASWSELLLARALMTGEVLPAGERLVRAFSAPEPAWGVAAAAAVLMVLPGLVALAVVRSRVATGLSLGRL